MSLKSEEISLRPGTLVYDQGITCEVKVRTGQYSMPQGRQRILVNELYIYI